MSFRFIRLFLQVSGENSHTSVLNHSIHPLKSCYCISDSSPVLASIIFNMTFDKNESLIDLGEDIGADVVEELIRYVYTGRVEAIEEIADRLVAAADKYELPNLKMLCESVLTQQVRMENAIQMYTLGDEVHSARLKRRAFAIMKA